MSKRQVWVVEIATRKGDKFYPIATWTQRQYARASADAQRRYDRQSVVRVVRYVPEEE